MLDLLQRLEQLEALEQKAEELHHQDSSYSDAELNQLLMMARMITDSEDPDQILRALLSSSVQLVGAERGVLGLVDAQGKIEWKLALLRDGSEFSDPASKVSHSVIHRVLESGLPLKSENLDEHSALSTARSVVDLALKSCLCVPIRIQGKVAGVIYVDNSSTSIFTSKMLVLLDGFCELGSVILTHARLRREQQERFRELQSLQAYHQRIVNALPSSLIVYDQKGLAHFVNAAFQQGIVDGAQVIPDRDAPAGLRLSPEFASQLDQFPETEKTSFEISLDQRIYRCWRFPLPAQEASRGLRGAVLMEISEQKKLERELLENEKRSMVSRMAGSIAHEIKNALAPLTGHLDIMPLKLKDHPEALKVIASELKIIEEMASRVGRITSNLSQLSKPLRFTPTRINLNLQARSVTELLRETSGKIKHYHVVDMDRPDTLAVPEKTLYELRLELEPGLPSIQADPDLLEQLLLNLVINAAHAVEAKGKGWVSIRTVHGIDSVVLEIEDNGCGISPDNLKRIWEPYFTTKGEKGTGMGLHFVRMVADTHNAELTLSSEEGQGTCFSLAFPLLNQ